MTLMICLTLPLLVSPEIDKTALSLLTLVIAVPFGAILPLKHTQSITIAIGQDIKIPETYNLRIECPIHRANPFPSISWFHENQTIPGRHSQYTVLSDGTLVVKHLTRHRDDGVYTCVADSPDVGQDESSSTVTVTGTSTQITFLHKHSLTIGPLCYISSTN